MSEKNFGNFMANHHFLYIIAAVIFSILSMLTIIVILKSKKERDIFDLKAKELGCVYGIQMAIGVFIWQGTWKDYIVTMNLIQSWSKNSKTKTGGIEISIYGGNIKSKKLMDLLSTSQVFYLTKHDNFKTILPENLLIELQSMPYSSIKSANGLIVKFLPNVVKFAHPEVINGIQLSCIIPKDSNINEISTMMDKMKTLIKKF